MKDGLSILNVTWAWPQGSVDWWQVKCLRLWRGPRGRFRPASPALGDHKRLMPWLQNRWVVHFPLCSAKPPESKKKRPLRDYVLLYRHAKLLLYVANDWWSQYLHKYNTYSYGVYRYSVFFICMVVYMLLICSRTLFVLQWNQLFFVWKQNDDKQLFVKKWVFRAKFGDFGSFVGFYS